MNAREQKEADEKLRLEKEMKSAAAAARLADALPLPTRNCRREGCVCDRGGKLPAQHEFVVGRNVGRRAPCHLALQEPACECARCRAAAHSPRAAPRWAAAQGPFQACAAMAARSIVTDNHGEALRDLPAQTGLHCDLPSRASIGPRLFQHISRIDDNSYHGAIT